MTISVSTASKCDFVVGNQHMAAGTYDITTDQSTLLVRGEDNGSANFAIALRAYAGKNQGRELRVSKVERELARNSAKPEIVTLIAAVPRAQRAAK